MSDILDESIISISNQLSNKSISASELLDLCQKNIKKYNPQINALITEVSPVPTQQNSSPLSNIPFVLKDAYITKGILTTAASKVLGNYVPQYSATVVDKLSQNGAVLVGKANMDAWGHGGSTENTDFKASHNPWDETRSAGGSGGGPAAAVTSKMCLFAIGEDTGGSIRNPAAWCNVTGLKVSYGRVSRYGSIAYASSLDTVGPTAKTAEDCAVVLAKIAGKDPLDATSSPHQVPDYLSGINMPIKDIRIGWPKEFFDTGLDPQIKSALQKAARDLESQGARIIEVSLPSLDYAVACYYLIAPSETSSNLARYDGIRYGLTRDNFTLETKRRILIGTYALSAGYYDAYYKKALQVRTKIISDYQDMFNKCDLIISPVTPGLPSKLGEMISDPIKNMLADIYTVTTNTAGIPALALPCGKSIEGLPIGMQFQGPMFSEDLLLRVGHNYQQATNWHHARPFS